ncbi:xanthine dehydrogenase accessory protein XdhC [Psychromonas sp. PT13]|uniref:xanthine dehydrogenase accessory protein XdhC n=1 Tax=Psychromonas sp. PT13 TaxID=3439547 RepID=UPI003EBF6B89
MSSAVKHLFTDPKLDWLKACQNLEQDGQAYCIITIVAQAGSLPRGTGSKMVVTPTEQFDTLGGGQLEFEVIRQAREGLVERKTNGNASQIEIERFGLAADLGQCCGGAAQVMFEYINTSLPRVVVFGAGHVCQSLSAVLKELPCNLVVVDDRKSWLKTLAQQGITTAYYENPSEAVALISEDTHIVIMTHEHALDFEIARLALERNCFPFIGLIGSESKKQRFEQRLKEQLSSVALIDNLTCPVGDLTVQGKLPMQVAVSISVQLMGLFEQYKPQQSLTEKVNEQQWKQTNSLRKALKKNENDALLKSS